MRRHDRGAHLRTRQLGANRGPGRGGIPGRDERKRVGPQPPHRHQCGNRRQAGGEDERAGEALQPETLGETLGRGQDGGPDHRTDGARPHHDADGEGLAAHRRDVGGGVAGQPLGGDAGAEHEHADHEHGKEPAFTATAASACPGAADPHADGKTDSPTRAGHQPGDRGCADGDADRGRRRRQPAQRGRTEHVLGGQGSDGQGGNEPGPAEGAVGEENREQSTANRR